VPDIMARTGPALTVLNHRRRFTIAPRFPPIFFQYFYAHTVLPTCLMGNMLQRISKSLCSVLLVSAGVARCATVVFRPVEIQDVLVNPGMGIQTFQRYNGDALNPGVEWSEEGPVHPLIPTAQ
jgi:hypothetical protein